LSFRSVEEIRRGASAPPWSAADNLARPAMTPARPGRNPSTGRFSFFLHRLPRCSQPRTREDARAGTAASGRFLRPPALAASAREGDKGGLGLGPLTSSTLG
jgi:hypothetical protein